MRQVIEHIIEFVIKYKFGITFLFFGLWILIWGSPSYFFYKEKKDELRELNRQINFYESETKRNRKFLDELSSDKETIERFARERYFFQKKDEVVYRIEESD